jgi:tRNA U34 2-thiouridine synthase MnmA/TrmU
VGRKDRPIANNALQVAAEIGVPVQLMDIADEYLPVVLNPKFGYGRNMNPCVDCRVFMLNKAKEYMAKVGADFVFTGEVLGQRPKSQLKHTMRKIDKEVQLEGRLLRPLSAQLLSPTIVEQEGRVDRSKLLGIHGRGRKHQIALAKKYGLSTFMQPAGGCCFLTDKAYSTKFRDIIEHNNGNGVEIEDVFVLGVGRHFRMASDLKLIVGRDETENAFLEHYAKDHWLGKVRGVNGPTAVVMGGFDDDRMKTMASVIARYCDAMRGSAVEVSFSSGDRERAVTVTAANDDMIAAHRV